MLISFLSLFFLFFFFFNSRLHSNNLNCDCHLAWLAQWLRQRPTIGLFTQCTSPTELRGLNVAEVQKHEFSCSGKTKLQKTDNHENISCLLFSSRVRWLASKRAGVAAFLFHIVRFDQITHAKKTPRPCCEIASLLSHCVFVSAYSPGSHLTARLPPGNPTALLWPLSCVSSFHELVAVPGKCHDTY